MNHQLEQFNQEDIVALEKLDELIESAELELQKAVTMVRLNVDAEEAFKDVISCMDQMGEVALAITGKNEQFVATQKISLYSSHFQEVSKQVQIN